MEHIEHIKVHCEKLLRFSIEVLKREDLGEEEAYIVADSLLRANLRGVDSHGIIRLSDYARRLRGGGSRPHPQIKRIKESSATLLLDGDNGMAQVVSLQAMKEAIKKAKQTGIGISGVYNSSHFGMASYYALEAVKEKMIGISMSNTPPVMAAWGGTKAVIGNNPLAIVIPFREDEPIVYDISMSRVSGGKIRLAAKNKESIPKGWAIDRFGKESENPLDFIEGGALLPFGEYKGYGLAIVVEILSGALTGAGLLSDIPLWFKEVQRPTNIGHLFGAIDISCFIPFELFRERLEWMISQLKSSLPTEGFKEILYPGEVENRKEREYRREGIHISEEVWKDLSKLAEHYHISLDIAISS